MTIYEEDDIVQVPEEHGENVQVQVNDHDMEEDDNVNNIVEDDGTKTLIHDTFSARMDDDRDDFDDVHDIPLLEMASQSIYKGSKQLFCLLYHC